MSKFFKNPIIILINSFITDPDISQCKDQDRILTYFKRDI